MDAAHVARRAETYHRGLKITGHDIGGRNGGEITLTQTRNGGLNDRIQGGRGEISLAETSYRGLELDAAHIARRAEARHRGLEIARDDIGGRNRR